MRSRHLNSERGKIVILSRFVAMSVSLTLESITIAVVTPELTEIQFAAPSGELLARPHNPRATGASVQASAEWLRDYPVEGGGSQLRGFFGQVSKL